MNPDPDLNRVLHVLEKDGTLTPDQVAVQLGLDPEKVRRLVQEARETGLLLRTKAVVNWQKAGDTTVIAYIEVKVVPQRGVGFDKIAERIYRFPEVRSVYLMSGSYDLGVMVAGPTMQDVASFVSEKLATLETVTSTLTHFVLKRYKEDGEILEIPGTTDRLAVSP